ncbi:MAG TPA: endonuclease MutS2, partial [Candidatus Cloacimonadota bacterium]|nr:endonuclease MutS2 [Candidatus Cloacimonadota bacterium]
MIQNQILLARMDFLYGCARLCNVLKAKVPVMIQSPRLQLTGARHPLLILRSVAVDRVQGYHKVIPFDLELGSSYRLLVLSGPNTGGKTVLMKAVGLITLMALSGLPVPVDQDSEIGLFTTVLADIGDDQSIENALSTFSSHLDKILKMLDTASPEALILIDEIGA